MRDGQDRERAGAAELLRDAGHAIRERILLVIALPLIAAAGAFAFSSTQPDEYQATSTLLLRDRQLAQIVSNYSAPPRDPTRDAQTNVDLVRSRAVETRVAGALEGEVPASDVAGSVSVNEQGGSDLVDITATSGSPATAALIANTWANQYISFRKEADQSQILESISVIDRRLASLSESRSSGDEGVRLREQRNQLEVIASLQTGNAELVNPASPRSSPASPRPVRSAVLAGLLGLFAAIVSALLIRRFDNRLEGPEDVEEVLHARTLGDLPISPSLRWRPGKHRREEVGPREREAFRMLRTNLTYFSEEGDLNSLLVTSASAGEGKTTVAINLARAFAESGARTLLLEADLRRPTLAARLKLGASPGLTGSLGAQASWQRSIVKVPLDGTASPAFSDDLFRAPSHELLLDVLPCGSIPPNPLDVLESRAFGELLAQLRERYDVVVVDGPPVLGLSDVAPLARYVAGTLVVAHMDIATTASVRALQRQLSLLGARILGIAINGSPNASVDNYYTAGMASGVAD